ncbi:DUF6049 family protein [Amnibacterium sp.]|uniref:DUF6049 family protein n=1 Tax=Amnibacterium sp. TaxID=1872496 RepID=UPI00261D2356|nr:DUF6049 family protein [Amnibacterium sp.]MCU1474196.1 sortase [Amnibacterium sp.]
MRTGIRLATAAAVAAVLSAAGVAPAHAATSTPTMTIAPRNAGVLAPGSALDLDLAITNPGTGTLAGGEIHVALEQAPVLGVSTLTDQIEHPGAVLQGYLVATTRSPSVPAGTTARMHVHLSKAVVDSVIDGSAGARLVGADLRVGATPVLAYSAVTRIPKGFGGRVGLGTVVPVTAPAGTTGIVPAGELATLTEPGGEWHRAVDAAEADPQATVLLDPEVQASIRLAGSAAPDSATGLLARLGALPNEVIRLPYADGDVTLQRAAGAQKVLAPTSFAGGTVAAAVPGATTGPTTTGSPTPSPAPTAAATPSDSALLQWDYSSTDVAWPVPGSVSAADLPFLAASGYPVAILSSADIADTARRVAGGPHARVGSNSVLIADATASRLLATAAAGSDVRQSAALAELIGLLGTVALTHEASSVLAVPARTGDAPALTRVLASLSGQSWITGTSLATLASTSSPTAVRLRAGTVPAARLAPAQAAVRDEAAVRELGTAIRTRATRLTGPERLALLGVMSTSWRSPQRGWSKAVRGVDSQLRRFVRNVRFDHLGSITYVGGSGSLPVYLTNQLDEPVEVVLAGTASNGRLHIQGTEVVDIPAQGGAKAKLPVKSISNGQVAVTFTIRTKDGHVIGKPATADIAVNAGWEAVGAVVFVAAMLALFGTGVYRNVRRARRRLKGTP